MGGDGERWRQLPWWWMDRWYVQWGETREDSILDLSTCSALICRLFPTFIFYTHTHTHTRACAPHPYTNTYTHAFNSAFNIIFCRQMSSSSWFSLWTFFPQSDHSSPSMVLLSIALCIDYSTRCGGYGGGLIHVQFSNTQWTCSSLCLRLVLRKQHMDPYVSLLRLFTVKLMSGM